ncbi:MAG: type II 3-dehydroquinate dehydratase [Candidatus Adiutrix sp.]|jgi:3-dehydroquinate dehydratase-2|nr:type II 3-dehydroquinate dehydratase [Candidatus Adiutrix sp.]
MKILVINGPNLNLLGTREPELYGSLTLDALNRRLRRLAGDLGLETDFLQSNHEGELVEAVQSLRRGADGAILNAGGYTHTSVALRDAVLAADRPVVEVHLTNPAAREEFRRVSLLAGAARGSIAGFGPLSYELALWWFHRHRAYSDQADPN